jgi:hypothetical protein
MVFSPMHVQFRRFRFDRFLQSMFRFWGCHCSWGRFAHDRWFYPVFVRRGLIFWSPEVLALVFDQQGRNKKGWDRWFAAYVLSPCRRDFRLSNRFDSILIPSRHILMFPFIMALWLPSSRSFCSFLRNTIRKWIPFVQGGPEVLAVPRYLCLWERFWLLGIMWKTTRYPKPKNSILLAINSLVCSIRTSSWRKLSANGHDESLWDWLLSSSRQIQPSDPGEIMPHIRQGCSLSADSANLGACGPLAFLARGHLLMAMFLVCFTHEGSFSIESLPKREWFSSAFFTLTIRPNIIRSMNVLRPKKTDASPLATHRQQKTLQTCPVPSENWSGRVHQIAPAALSPWIGALWHFLIRVLEKNKKEGTQVRKSCDLGGQTNFRSDPVRVLPERFEQWIARLHGCKASGREYLEENIIGFVNYLC